MDDRLQTAVWWGGGYILVGIDVLKDLAALRGQTPWSSIIVWRTAILGSGRRNSSDWRSVYFSLTHTCLSAVNLPLFLF